jgi:hypothetical protein
MARNVDFDADEVMRNLKLLAENVDSASKNSLQAVGDEVLRLSSAEVPHDVGTLQGTGHTEPAGDEILVGYNTKYAARLHEHPEFRFQKGRKGKYLEDPIKNNIDTFNSFLGKKLQVELFVKSKVGDKTKVVKINKEGAK